MTTYDLAVSRQKTVAAMDKTIARLSAQATEARSLQAEIKSAILDGAVRLPDAVLAFEAKIISLALRQSSGQVKKAAELLGISWQTLGEMLKNRHRALASERTPVIPRRGRSKT